MNDNTLQWVEVADLEPGESFTLGTSCQLTFGGRNVSGLDRIELADDVWPYVAADLREVAA